jgi:hypothetical protein
LESKEQAAIANAALTRTLNPKLASPLSTYSLDLDFSPSPSITPQIQGKEGNNIEGNSASLAIQEPCESKVAILLLVLPCNPAFLSLLSLFEIRSLSAQDR